MGLTKEILNSFHLSGDIVPLSGGQNTSVRVSNAVLKPVDDIQHSEWVQNIIYNISPQGYRVSKPIRSKHGTFVSRGWACTQYEIGKDVKGRIEEKLTSDYLSSEMPIASTRLASYYIPSARDHVFCLESTSKLLKGDDVRIRKERV